MTEIPSIPFGRLWITDKERDAVQKVLEGHILTHGAKCKEYASFRHCQDVIL